MEACLPTTPVPISSMLSPSTAPPSGSPVSASYSPATLRVDIQRMVEEGVKQEVKNQMKVISERQFQQNAVLWKRVSEMETSQGELANRVKQLENLLRENKIAVPASPIQEVAGSVSSFALSPEPGMEQEGNFVSPSGQLQPSNPFAANWWQGTG
eukprot:TRINITY_DN12341_c2_g1_i2.p1 TRINITY_DN12341_c2_g1~~TRINITY_DN12341_c2_g1_i2.p1  ORF type:complete len:155 (+),score=36.64 TRINITY_DN12341_c2_g1_i2:627-1091(+)